MKILITGASGYVGSYLSDYLNRPDEYQLTLLVRKTPDYLKDLGEHVTIVESDILDREKLKKALTEKYDAIVHLAAFNDVDTNGNPEKALLVNAFGTRNILQLGVDLGVTNFIYFSVLQVYGRELDGHYTASSEVLCDNDYSLNHFAAEEYCRMYAKNYGVSTSVVRLAYAFGCPFDARVDRWTLVPEAFCLSAFNEGKIILKSSGRASRDFVPIRYVAQSVEHLIKQPKAGHTAYNMTSEVVIPIIDTAHLVKNIGERVLNKKIDLIVESDEPKTANHYRVENNLLGPLQKSEVESYMADEMEKIFLMLNSSKND